jgi:DNA modification methylase
MPDNTLFYGDNLEILRHYVKDESVDLIYLDPPFNSKRDYNMPFTEPSGKNDLLKSRRLKTLGFGMKMRYARIRKL